MTHRNSAAPDAAQRRRPPRPGRRRRQRYVLAAAGLLVLTAGCGSAGNSAAGGGGAGSGGTTGSNLTHITVLQQPVASWAPLYMAQIKGFYAREGLAVTFQSTQNASTALPLLLNGQAQFAGASPPVIITAVAHGVPVTLVKGALMGNVPPVTKPWGGAAIVAAKGSNIRSWADLKGKKIAVSGLQGFPQLGIMLGLKRAGVDPSSVTFVDIPYPDMTSALLAGRVDAALTGQPFRQQQIAAGLRLVVGDVFTYAFASSRAGIPAAGTIAASQAYVKAHPDVVKRFVTALDDATKYLAAHPQEQAQAVRQYIHAPASVLASLHPEYYPPDPEGAYNVNALAAMAQEMQRLGWIPSVPPVSEWVQG